MNNKKNNRGGAIVKLVIWSCVLVVLVAAFVLALVFNGGKLNGIDINIGSGFSLISGYVYDNADKYSVGNASFSGELKNLDIEWIEGEIKLLVYDGDEVKAEESGAGNRDENMMRTYLYNGTLYIKYAKSGVRLFSTLPTKDLTVYLPRNYASAINNIDINAASADVTIEKGIICRDISLEAVSGKVCADIIADNAEFQSVSGDVTLRGEIGSIDIEGVSNKANITLSKAPTSLEVKSVSGDIALVIPIGSSFEAELDSVSGDMTLNGKNVGKYCKEGMGDARFDFESVSGNIEITLQ